MPAFSYQAYDPKGARRTGVVEASDGASARHALRQSGLLPVALTPALAGPSGRSGSMSRNRIGGRALALMTRQLAALVSGGVRIDDALETIARQSAQPKITALVMTLRSEISEGRTLADAMADHGAVFSGFYRASIAAAEQSNRLGPVLTHLASHIEAEQRNRQSVQLALLYPALLAVVSLIVVILLLTYVVPDIARVFAQRGENLPVLTRTVIGAGDVVADWGWAVLLALGALAATMRAVLSRPAARLSWHRVLVTARLTRFLVIRQEAARFAGTMATLLQSGVSLPHALESACNAVGNLHMRDRLKAAAAEVRDGAPLARALDEQSMFPPVFIAMVASGEASADIGAALARVAEDQQRDLDQFVTAAVALVEPGVLLVMGGIVLVLVLAILQPIIGFNAQAGAGL